MLLNISSQFISLLLTWSLNDRFDQKSFAVVKKLEECLLTGLVTEGIKSYQENDSARLSVQLPMFRSSYVYSSVEQSVDVIKSSTAEILIVRR